MKSEDTILVLEFGVKLGVGGILYHMQYGYVLWLKRHVVLQYERHCNIIK
jgi:hypothetical protein